MTEAGGTPRLSSVLQPDIPNKFLMNRGVDDP